MNKLFIVFLSIVFILPACHPDGTATNTSLQGIHIHKMGRISEKRPGYILVAVEKMNDPAMYTLFSPYLQKDGYP